MPPITPATLAAIPECAPQIIQEINPFTWFERVIRAGHEYKLAKEQIKGQSEKVKGELSLELEKLNAQKEVYLASIDNERRLLAEAHKPTMKALDAFFKDLDSTNKQSSQILEMIISNIGKLDIEFYDRLMSFHSSLFSNRLETYQNIQQTLEHSRKNLKEQLNAINSKVINQKSLQGKDL